VDPPNDRRRLRTLGLVITAAALVVRIVYVWSVSESPSVRYPMVDSLAYHERALEILAGDFWGSGVFYQDPLYPYFLALIYAIAGPGSVAVLYVQALLDALTAGLVYALALRVFEERTAFLAGGIAALYKVFFFYDALLLKVALSLFAITTALYLLLRARASDRAGLWLGAGAALGVATLTRGNYLLFVPPLFLWMLWAAHGPLPRRVRSVAWVALGLGLAILPVTARNVLVGHDAVLITSQAGQNFFIGNYAGATGTYRAPPFVRSHPFYEQEDFRAEAERRTGRPMKPSEVSRFWLAETARVIGKDPARFVWLLGRKARLFAGAYEVPDNQSFDFFARYVAPVLRLPLPTWGFVFPLALCGMVFARRNRDALLLIAYFAAYAASVILFYDMSRYRIPAAPVAIVFAAGALVQITAWLRARELRAALPALVFLLMAWPLVHLEVVPVDLGIYHINLGNQLLADSAEHRRRALQLAREGDEAGARRARDESEALRARAEVEFRTGLGTSPDNERLGSGLRKALVLRVGELESLGRLEEAREITEELVTRYPDAADGHAFHGAVLLRLGRLEEAEAALRTALRLDPREPRARRELRRLERRRAGDSEGDRAY
jgi:4-amino-4-deoxy-L-arabinose transferase-like glycosyltransferase